MPTPHPDVHRHQHLQQVFAREMAMALKQEVRYLKLPADERRSLLRSLTHAALCVIDSTPIEEKDGSPIDPRLIFIPEGESFERAIYPSSMTYLHEMSSPESDPLFDFESED